MLMPGEAGGATRAIVSVGDPGKGVEYGWVGPQGAGGFGVSFD